MTMSNTDLLARIAFLEAQLRAIASSDPAIDFESGEPCGFCEDFIGIALAALGNDGTEVE